MCTHASGAARSRACSQQGDAVSDGDGVVENEKDDLSDTVEVIGETGVALDAECVYGV